MSCSKSGNSPILCISDYSSDQSANAGISWKALSNSQIYQAVFKDTPNNPIQNLTFEFATASSGSFAYTKTDTSLSVQTGSEIRYLAINSNNKGIQIGANGDGILAIKHLKGNNSSTNRSQFKITNLSSFKGNLEIYGGSNFQDIHHKRQGNVFDASLSGDFVGNITIRRQDDGEDNRRSQTYLTFSGNGNLTGNLTFDRTSWYGDNIVELTFESGKMAGNITATGGGTLVFSGNLLTGNISSDSGDAHLIFDKKVTIQGNISAYKGFNTITGSDITLTATNSSPALWAYTQGDGKTSYNHIILSSDSSPANLNISGDIRSGNDYSVWAGEATNLITANNGASIKVNGSMIAYDHNGVKVQNSNNIYIQSPQSPTLHRGINDETSSSTIEVKSISIQGGGNNANRLIIGKISQTNEVAGDITKLTSSNLLSSLSSLAGSIKVGENGKDAIMAYTRGDNLLSAHTIQVNGNIKSQGTNMLYAHNTTINGSIQAYSGGRNTLISDILTIKATQDNTALHAQTSSQNTIYTTNLTLNGNLVAIGNGGANNEGNLIYGGIDKTQDLIIKGSDQVDTNAPSMIAQGNYGATNLIQTSGKLTATLKDMQIKDSKNINQNIIIGGETSAITLNEMAILNATSEKFGVERTGRGNNLYIQTSSNSPTLQENTITLQAISNHGTNSYNRLVIGKLNPNATQSTLVNLTSSNLISNLASFAGHIKVEKNNADALLSNDGENLLVAERIHIAGNVKSQNSGINAFVFQEGIFQGTISAEGKKSQNIFNIISSDSKMGKDSTSNELTFTGSNGSNIINLAKEKAHLTLLQTNAGGDTFADSKIGLTNQNGTTQINFNSTGSKLTLTTLKTTNGAKTNINILDGVNGVLEGIIKNENQGKTNLNFDSDKNNSSSTIFKIDQVSNDGGHTLSQITLGWGNEKSTNNILDLSNAGSLSVEQQLIVGSTNHAQDLTIKLLNTTLKLNNGLTTQDNGVFKLQLAGGSNQVQGAQFASGKNLIHFLPHQNNTTLTWQDTHKTTTNITTTGGLTEIYLFDGATATITGGITTSNTGATKLIFGANSTTKPNTQKILKLGETSNTQNSITNIKFANGNSTGNTLDLTSSSHLSVLEKIKVGDKREKQDLTILLKNTDLTLSQGLFTGTQGKTTLKISSNTNATLNGGDLISLTSLDFVGNQAKLTIKSANTSIHTLNPNAIRGNELIIDASGSTHISTTIHSITANQLTITLKGVVAPTQSNSLNLYGGTIHSLNITDTHNNLNLLGGITTITENLTGHQPNTKALNATLKNNATLALGGEMHTLSTLTAIKGSKINLARVQSDGSTPIEGKERKYKTLTIGEKGSNQGFKGETEFEVYVGADFKADKVIFSSATKQDNQKESIATITASGDRKAISYGKGKTLVATVEADAKGKMKVQGGKKRIGALDITTILTMKEEGESENYYLAKDITKIDESYQKISTSALLANYDLYIANYNSISKRLGELRDSSNTQGIWTRVFGGAMSNEFGSGSKTTYLINQTGYDYALEMNKAKNLLGIAISYGRSWTKGNTLQANNFNGTTSAISLSSLDSSLLEVAFYNSYISDNGWYNDTILKLDYLMGKFSLSNNQSLQSKINNFAMVLSNEVGYRYGFWGGWYLEPQLELSFGYFNQSKFKRMIEGEEIIGNKDSILTLRSRIGSALGKKFEGKKSSISVYVGAFYEFDKLYGGEGKIGTADFSDPLSPQLCSNARMVVNLGSYITIGEATRIYIDAEKSFGEKQRTFMQFNTGVRYSFGESKRYTPQEKGNVSTPLKIERK